jgi:hypothetical protein
VLVHTIGGGTKIWHFSPIHSGACIGDKCSLDQMNERLAEIVETPVIPKGYYSIFAQYTIKLKNRKQRDSLHEKAESCWHSKYDLLSQAYA